MLLVFLFVGVMFVLLSCVIWIVFFLSDQASVKEQEQSNSGHASPLPQSEGLNTADNPADNNIMVVDSVFQPQVSLMDLCLWFVSSLTRIG